MQSLLYCTNTQFVKTKRTDLTNACLPVVPFTQRFVFMHGTASNHGIINY